MSKKQKKVEIVQELEQLYSAGSSIIFTHYHGLTVNQVNNLRKSLKHTNAKFRVVKNTLSKIAAENSNISIEDKLAVGPVAIAYTEDDPAAVAKTVVEFSKTNTALKIVGGLVDNKVYTKENVEELAKLPPLNVLRAKLVGVIQAPATQLVRMLSAAPAQLVRVVSAYSKK